MYSGSKPERLSAGQPFGFWTQFFLLYQFLKSEGAKLYFIIQISMSFRSSETCKFPLYHLLVSWSVGWLAGYSVCIKRQLVIIWLTNIVLTFVSCFVLDFALIDQPQLLLPFLFFNVSLVICFLFVNYRKPIGTNWIMYIQAHSGSSLNIAGFFCIFLN